MLNFFRKILKLKRTKVRENVRRVYFGLRIRFLGLLFLVMLVIIFILSLVMNINQKKLLYNEKTTKAGELAQILSGHAEFYLDRDINTTRDEYRLKYETISKEAFNFLKVNQDIYKIMLADEKSRIHYSTIATDANKVYNFSYFKACLAQKEEALNYHYFVIKANKKKEKYLAITYPIFLHSGEVVDVLADYDRYYKKYYDASLNNRKYIYQVLWNKYKRVLTSEYDPVLIGKNNNEKVIKAGDIDFIFLKLFSDIMWQRKWRINSKEYSLWNEKWLIEYKRKKLQADLTDKVDAEKKALDAIKDRMQYLYNQMTESKRLGALAIIYNVDKVNRDLNKNLKQTFIIASIILFLSLITFLFVINFMIKNLKRLERWALNISHGNLDSRIEITTNDEIGRLSDIFNNMLNELKIKYHLEKFVSRSTRSMIGQHKDKKNAIVTGRTGKKNFSFIFSDVRGFTSFTERNDPEVVIEVLNLYFELQAKIIKAKKGDIDDYVGDQIMAHFGGEKRADTVIQVALDIMHAVTKMNEKRKKNNQPYFEIGIGINGGDVIVGNIGAGFRMDFTCLGDAVNLTSRLCSAAQPGQILASKTLYSQSSKIYKVKQLEPISVKGKENKIEVVQILS